VRRLRPLFFVSWWIVLAPIVQSATRDSDENFPQVVVCRCFKSLRVVQFSLGSFYTMFLEFLRRPESPRPFCLKLLPRDLKPPPPLSLSNIAQSGHSGKAQGCRLAQGGKPYLVKDNWVPSSRIWGYGFWCLTVQSSRASPVSLHPSVS